MLGDCYFLCVISDLAEIPDRIKNLFPIKTANAEGRYLVRICDMGEWKEIVVDDWIPSIKTAKGYRPAFTQTNEQNNKGELWVLLLEKAWAKLYGSYQKIEGGLEREALKDLTSAPTRQIKRDQTEFLWEQLKTGEQRNWIMTMGSADAGVPEEVYDQYGLIPGHAYALLAAMEVPTSRGMERIVKIRNPWGRKEWCGDYSDNSPLWTPELRRLLNHFDKSDDGTFFITFNDLIYFMDDYSICYVEDNFKYNVIRGACTNRKAAYFRFQVTQKGRYYITVNQQSTRKYAVAQNYEYPSVFLVVAQEVKPGEYRYVSATADCYKEVWVDGELEPGNYIAYTKVLWAHNTQEEFTISTYGPADARIRQVPKANAPEFLASTFVDFARRNGTNISPVDKQGQAIRGELPEDQFGGFQYIYYRNRGNFTVYETLNFQGCEGITLVKPHRGMQTNVVVPPGSEAIVLARCDPRYYRFAVGMSTRLSAGQPTEDRKSVV